MLKGSLRDPTTIKNRFAMLHLGSSDLPTTGYNTSSSCDSETRIIFADPCSLCGTKKRRLSPLQPHSFKPRKKSKNTTSSPIKKSPHSSSLSFSTLTTSTPPSSPLSGGPSLAGFNLFSGFSDVRLNSPEASPASAQRRPPRPPVLLRSVSDLLPNTRSKDPNPDELNVASPPIKPPSGVPYLGRLNSFSGSSGTPDASPATVEHPPCCKPVLRRTVSDLLPKRADTTSDEKNTGPETPDEMRWKRMKDSLAEMSNWVNNLIQEEEPEKEEEQQQIVVSPANLCGCEENGGAERDGDAYRVIHKCCCGKRYHIVFSILPED